jgi:molybdate transport system regulatory protein
MQMSYRTAWQLVTQMNKHFAQPLVETKKGGAARGGAMLTPTGAEVLKLYRSMEQRAVRSIQKDVAILELLLKR